MLEDVLMNTVGKKVEDEFFRNCKKDKSGNPIVVGNFILRGFSYVFLPLSFAILGICIFDPSFYIIEGIDPKNIPLVMYIVSIFLILTTASILRHKATLEKDTLFVRSLFSKRKVSLDELRLAALKQVPKVVGPGFVSFATDRRNVRVMFLTTVGGVEFVKLICNSINAPLPPRVMSLSQTRYYQ